MPGLRIAVLGKPRVTRDDDSPVELGSAKATALLLYLATTGERHSRSALAGLLWGDLPEDGARANLRLALTKLRRVADDNLQVTRGYVAVDPSSYWLDRRELEAALRRGQAHLELGRHLRPTQTTPGDWGRDEHLSRSRELFCALGTEPARLRASVTA